MATCIAVTASARLSAASENKNSLRPDYLRTSVVSSHSRWVLILNDVPAVQRDRRFFGS